VIDSPLLTFPAGHVHPRIFFAKKASSLALDTVMVLLVRCSIYGI
jgi:hypothetical protein